MPDQPIAQMERAIVDLEAGLDPLFIAGRYRDFFERAHQVRTSFERARLPSEARRRLWDRLNRCTESAKVRQAQEFHARNAANLARWREQLAAAERYAGALVAEIAALEARDSAQPERALWLRRAGEKRDRLTDVRRTIETLRGKIADVERRMRE